MTKLTKDQNNHQAHGPVSLERLHQIREILSKAAAQSDGGNLGYAMADAVKVIDGAIAAFDADPQRNPVLAYADSYRDMAKRGVESIPVWSVITDLERNIAPLYTAPPAPAVPEEKRDDDGNTTSEFDHGWNACRAAMLSGDTFREISNSSTKHFRENAETSTSDPVSDAYKLAETQFKPVADLYALCWEPGDVVTYTPEPEKAVIWLNNYSGTCVQEYVKLERLQESSSGNSPVTPDGYVLVPVEPTDEMIVAAMDSDDVTYNDSDDTVFYVHHREIYKAMLAAAPQQQNAQQNIPEIIPGWIKCSEHMPEDETTVLVCQEGGIIFCAEVADGCFYPDEFPNIPVRGREITHWMPLPVAPAKSENTSE